MSREQQREHTLPAPTDIRGLDVVDTGRTPWGLALCGGGACGYANIGVLEALYESGMRPDCIAGSSMGAVIAGLSALGHAPSTIMRAARSLGPLDVAKLSNRPLRKGLHGGLLEQRFSHLEPLFGDARIGDCEIPFVCVAGRVRAPIRWERLLLPGFVDHLRDNIALHVFGPHDRMLDALRASTAVPVVFSPVDIGGEQFIDLVHFGAVPARSLREAHDQRWWWRPTPSRASTRSRCGFPVRFARSSPPDGRNRTAT